MKIPCEVVVWQILPLVRRELARELVSTHGMSQAEVAKKFGVTDAAISQYLSRKRGGEYSVAPMYGDFINDVKESAVRIIDGTSDYDSEVCRICCQTKQNGFLAYVYKEQTGTYPPQCHFDPRELS